MVSKPNTKQSLIPVEPTPDAVVGLEVVVGGGTSEWKHDFYILSSFSEFLSKFSHSQQGRSS